MGDVARTVDDLALEHLTAVAWAWQRRQSVVRSRVWGLDALCILDEHIRAHLQGLHAAGPDGVEALEHASRWNDPGVTFVAVVLAGWSGDRDRLESVVADQPSWEHLHGVISGLAWLARPLALPIAYRWLAYDHSRWRALALAVHVEHRHDPRSAIDRGLLDGDITVRYHAAQACGMFGRRMLVPTLWALHKDTANEVDFEIGRALLMLGAPGAARLLWDHACAGETSGRGSGRAGGATRASGRGGFAAARCGAVPWPEQGSTGGRRWDWLRALAAFELSHRVRGLVVPFATDAPGWRQRYWLRPTAPLTTGTFDRPYRSPRRAFA